MLRLLRLPCALLALLLSALGGGRMAAVEHHDDCGKAPIISPAPATAALPDVPTPVPGPPPALLMIVEAGQTAPIAVLAIPDCLSLPAPCQRRGSAGGARAP